MYVIDPTSFIIAVSVVVMTIMLGVVAIYVVLLIADLRKTIIKVNSTLDMADQKIENITAPIENIANMASYLQSGLKVFDMVTKWAATRSATEKSLEASQANEVVNAKS